MNNTGLRYVAILLIGNLIPACLKKKKNRKDGSIIERIQIH